MEQFIEKLIGRLEELRTCSDFGTCNHCQNRWCPMELLEADEVTKIVKQLAEEHLKDKDWETTRRFLDEKYFSKIRELSEKYNHPCEDIPINFVWVFGLIEKIEMQLSEERNGGWIACSDKYPEDNRKVLTVDSEGNMEVLDYDTNYENSFCKYGGNVKVFDIIAWQPLPEPYNTEGE